MLDISMIILISDTMGLLLDVKLAKLLSSNISIFHSFDTVFQVHKHFHTFAVSS